MMARTCLLALLTAAVTGSGLSAQNRSIMVLDSLVRPTTKVENVPFGIGENLQYKVKAGIFNVGRAQMTVSGLDTVHGFPTYFAEWHIKGGVPFYSIDTWMRTWMDVESLISRKHIKDQHEGGRKRYRHFEFYPDRRVWHRVDTDTTATMTTAMPLDDVSFVYFARTLPLEVGETYTFNRYYRDRGNPVVLEVLRKDRREVPAGTFNTIVVRPLIRTRGLFSEGGEAEIHFSDDERRLVVYMKTRLPGMNLTMHLESIEEGVLLDRTGTVDQPPPTGGDR